LYGRAFREARELYVASAYLTSWNTQQALAAGCERVVFVVGTDFGITRKAALRQVLKWLPKHGTVVFGAVSGSATGGFHPKVLLWKTAGGQRRCVIGSSNLSKAAFATNYEANVSLIVSAQEYSRIAAWIDSVATHSAAINEDWIEHHYREARRPTHPGASGSDLQPAIKLKLPTGPKYMVRVKERRRAQAAFKEIAGKLRNAVRRCASKQIANAGFWDEFWQLWSEHPSRFQGSGLQMSGKAANWRQACAALHTILQKSDDGTGSELDHLVSLQIDRLRKAGNPARGAWLSEMLCHYFPEQYPVLNRPVRQWLKANKWRARRGVTEGQRYIELARQLRAAVRSKPAGARNLAELDLAIWQWVHDRP
jgi:predicted SpoU family rRNA methylase